MEISGLYQIPKAKEEAVIQLYLRAFSDYPKLMEAFRDPEDRKNALEATLRYYIPYDRMFGGLFSLDPEIREAIAVVHSDEMGYTQARHQAAGSYSAAYLEAMARMTQEQQRIRVGLFEEIDELEKEIPLPERHLYLDFLGVDPKRQRRGRGGTLLEKVSAYAHTQNLPLMLFTNTAEDIAFYQKRGFHIVGITKSETYGFTNTYLIKET